MCAGCVNIYDIILQYNIIDYIYNTTDIILASLGSSFINKMRPYDSINRNVEIVRLIHY